MKQFITIIILFATAIAVVESQQTPPKPITWKQDKDQSGEPFIVPVQDLSGIDIAATIGEPGCTCNCDGKCMEAIAELRAEVEALKVECANCGCGPRPLQSVQSVGGKTVTIRGRDYNLDSYLAQHGDGVQYGVAGMTIDEHLGHHGVEDASNLTTQEKHDLHSALHHAGVEANGNFVVRQTSPKTQTSTTRRSYPTYSSGGCANGRCNQPQRRFRLFR